MIRLPAGVKPIYLARSSLFGICTGLYLSASILFFVNYIGIEAQAIALALSLAFASASVLRIPTGILVDHFGSVRVWLISTACAALLFLGYLLVQNTIQFFVLTITLALCEGAISSSAVTYFGEVLPPETRARGNAYMRTTTNIGSGLGTIIGGSLIAVGTTAAYMAVVWAYFGIMVVDFVVIAVALRERRHPPAGIALAGGRTKPALRSLPFIGATTINAIVRLYAPMIGTILPLWIATQTEIPDITIPIALALNMVLIILLQVWAAQNSETISGALKTQRNALLALVLACIVLSTTLNATGPLGIVLIMFVVISLTGAELFGSASSWGIGYALAPKNARGQYLSLYTLGGQMSSALGPALISVIVIDKTPIGWLLVAIIFLSALFASGPITRCAQRDLPD